MVANKLAGRIFLENNKVRFAEEVTGAMLRTRRGHIHEVHRTPTTLKTPVSIVSVLQGSVCYSSIKLDPSDTIIDFVNCKYYSAVAVQATKVLFNDNNNNNNNKKCSRSIQFSESAKNKTPKDNPLSALGLIEERLGIVQVGRLKQNFKSNIIYLSYFDFYSQKIGSRLPQPTRTR